VLRLEGVSKRFHRGHETVVALDDVTFEVGPGEFIGLVGPSGSGKSTLLHLAGGLDQPDAGKVLVGDRDLATMSIGDRAKMRRRQIGFVFQFFHLIPTLTVAENVELPLTLDGASDEGEVRDVLARVGLSDRADHLPGELSGGQMQRAAIARALVAKPTLILADEPTGNLDSATGADVLDVLTAQVADAGASLVLVTHDAGAASRAHRVLHLKDGKLVSAEHTAPAAAAPRRRAPLKAGTGKAAPAKRAATKRR
jgi:ABC-type lipoprotein export system ATPase subunit